MAVGAHFSRLRSESVSGRHNRTVRQRPPQRELTERDRAILRDVIGTFILTGEPVSSRTVSRLERHGLSAASIRNVMADLEDLGFLTHPHTSAGRVPTGEGYHLYIDPNAFGFQKRQILKNPRATARGQRAILRDKKRLHTSKNLPNIIRASPEINKNECMGNRRFYTGRNHDSGGSRFKYSKSFRFSFSYKQYRR